MAVMASGIARARVRTTELRKVAPKHPANRLTETRTLGL